MKLNLVKLEKKYKRHLYDMMEEWYATGEKIIPYAIRRLDYHDFDNYMNSLEMKDAKEGKVPDSTFFCLDEERDIFVGAVNIRHYLNDSLLFNGGHIGDGVRPSERGKGVATNMIGLALKECKKLGIDKVLMVCDKENIGSAKSIRNNGGILENEVIVEGIVEQRYWISMDRTSKLILLRGNSGSGKTTTGKALQRKFGYGTMLISQDAVRREMLYVKDGSDTAAIPLLSGLASYGGRHCEIVILEGILKAEWYQKLFEALQDEFRGRIFAYYFDIPFAETLVRHQQKLNAHEFGEKEMHEWWNEKDFIHFIPEVCLSKELTLDEIVDRIYRDVISG